jgi:hypothetical protein
MRWYLLRRSLIQTRNAQRAKAQGVRVKVRRANPLTAANALPQFKSD